MSFIHELTDQARRTAVDLLRGGDTERRGTMLESEASSVREILA